MKFQEETTFPKYYFIHILFIGVDFSMVTVPYIVETLILF
jgi:hypothetical protein